MLEDQFPLLFKGLFHHRLWDRSRGNGRSGGVAFKNSAQLKKLCDLPAGDDRDEGTPVRDEFNQTIRHEQEQGLTDRCARNSDIPREFLFVDELSLHFRVHKDLVPQIFISFLPARSRLP